jgi:hypothetical protein
MERFDASMEVNRMTMRKMRGQGASVHAPVHVLLHHSTAPSARDDSGDESSRVSRVSRLIRRCPAKCMRSESSQSSRVSHNKF